MPAVRHRHVAALILAAGLSRRMAPANKILTTDARGKSMIQRVVAEARASQAEWVHVVIGHQAAMVQAALAGCDVTFVHADAYAHGLAASLSAGIGSLPAEADAVIVCLGDMPLVTATMIDRVIGSYDPEHGRLIVVPAYRGQRGNPVLWDRRYFPDMHALQGDIGARTLLPRYEDAVVEIGFTCDAVLTDFDTPEALAGLPPGRSR
jgi:molybdenum cofactor cytidylyltransferase